MRVGLVKRAPLAILFAVAILGGILGLLVGGLVFLGRCLLELGTFGRFESLTEVDKLGNDTSAERIKVLLVPLTDPRLR